MMEQKNWDNIKDVFHAMESCGAFLVLRNYEELTDDNYYMNGHADIDCLCEDAKKVRKMLQTKKNIMGRGKNHGFVLIHGQLVKFGFFHIGDGYYDAKWEKQMLETRVKHEGDFFVMNEENYFYSLLYHALLQKRKFSDEYRVRLRKMGENFGFNLLSDDDYKSCLFSYLIKEGYTVEYPEEPNVAVHFADVPKELLGKKKGWGFRRCVFFVEKKFGRLMRKVLNEHNA